MSAPYFFTWAAQREAQALPLAGGEGAWYWLEDGSRWLDLGSFSYQVNLGHGERRIINAIRAQADQLCLATPNADFAAKRELAERLLALAPPGFSKVFFTLGGAEANENALKIARMVTGRYKLVSRYRSYHGATMGALALTGDWRRPPLEPALPGVIHALDCYCDRCPFGKRPDSCERECARHIGDILALEGQGSVAAVVLEPVPGANGVLVPPADYWPLVRSACDRDGALLIADEVLTGFGRTGTCFAVEHWGVVPDIITCAKGLTGGYAPLGAVLVHERVASHFDTEVLACGLTSYAHPLGCAAGVAALKVYEEDALFARAAALEPVLLAELRAIEEQCLPVVEHVRGIGLLGCIELAGEPSLWRALTAALAARRVAVHAEPRRGTLIVAPPLVIEESELRQGMALVREAISEAISATKGLSHE